jgi:hypothetical protein
MESRLHFLRPGLAEVKIPEFDDAGEETGKILETRRADRIKEFWWFVKPGSVVMLDETADVWNAGDHKERPKTLQSMINHHGHYKLDLWFICQDKEDLDIQVRSKIMFVYEVVNMKYEPLLPGVPLLRGLKWPLQFFRVRILQGKKVLGKRGDMEKFQPLDSFTVFPNSRGYRNYRSFSAAHSTLAGMQRLKDGEEVQASSDLETGKQRLKIWIAGTGPLAAGLVGLVVALVVVLWSYWWMADGMKRPYLPWKSAVKKEVETQKLAAAVTNVAATVVSTNATRPAVGTNQPAVLRVLLSTPYGIKLSDGRSFRVGEETPAGVLRAVAVNGVRVGTNEYSFGNFLLLCRGSTGT